MKLRNKTLKSPEASIAKGSTDVKKKIVLSKKDELDLKMLIDEHRVEDEESEEDDDLCESENESGDEEEEEAIDADSEEAEDSDEDNEDEEDADQVPRELMKNKNGNGSAHQNSNGEDVEDDEEEEEDDEILNGMAELTFTGSNEDFEGGKEEQEVPHPQTKALIDEYEYDSSDEEDLRNTIGNIPLNWYDEYPHVGYDLDGKKLIKPKGGDAIDNFLKRMEDPNFWKTVKDRQTGQNVILSDDDIELLSRIKAGKIPDPKYEDFAPWIDWFSNEVMETPLKNVVPSKTSFMPSKIDAMKIAKMVRAIKRGMHKPQEKPSKDPQFYMLWESDDKADSIRRIQDHIPAPKTRLPSNAESYNPPSEYLLNDREMKDWDKKEDEPWKRKYNFMPQKYACLRHVPAYEKFIKERFDRCLDLYLCPRAKKMRLTIKAEDLVPQLPNPKDLQPFPTVLSMVFIGHTDMVRSISLDPIGQFFASGSDDGTVKIWEISTGRCMKTFTFEGVVRWVEWCPNKSLSLVAVANEKEVVLLNPKVGDKLIVEKTDQILKDKPDQGEYEAPERVTAVVTWEDVDGGKWTKGIRLVLKHFKTVRQVTWHGKGDYFSTVIPDGQNRSVVIHQLSKRRSQLPFNKSKGLVQCALFHPTRPHFLIATQKHVRIYDLLKQEIVKKLMTGAKWISSMAIHPGGDNVLLGTYDKKVMWFDLDLSTKPYQTLRHHGNAVRDVAFHKRYPLFASGSDDCSLIVSHGMVYHDLLQNPLIVPVKKLRGHEKSNDFGILSVMFHNMQPWVFSSGADKTIKLYT